MMNITASDPAIIKKNKADLMPSYAWFMWFLAAMFYCYEFLLRVMPSVMMGYLERFYHIDIAMLGLLASSYYFTYTPLQLIAGTLMDHYGVRRLLTMSVLLCGFGCYFFGLNNSFSLALIGRMIIGAGSAFAFVGVLKIAADWLPHRYFGMLSGATTAIGMLGAISGELFVNQSFKHFGIIHFLWYLIIFSFILAVFLYLFLRDKPSQIKHHPKLTQEISNVWHDIRIILGNRNIIYIGLIALFLFAPTTIFSDLWGVSYLKNVYHFDTHIASILSSCVYFGWIVGGPLIGYLSDHYHLRKLPLQFGSLFALVTSMLLLYGPFTHAQPIGILLFLMGFFSSSQVLGFAAATDITPTNKSGTAIALTNMFTMLSGLLQILVGYLLRNSGPVNIHIDNVGISAFHHAFALIPLCFLLACIVSTKLLTETHGTIRSLKHA
jgi:MFS family permease